MDVATHAPVVQRLPALDGLRAIAALAVMFSHVVEASADTISATLTTGAESAGAAWWLTRTPLAVLCAGPEFVIVFFVLSGFVLTRSLLTRPQSSVAFYLGRVTRLYLPVWLSLIPAAILLAVVQPAQVGGGIQPWLDTFSRPVDFHDVLNNAAIVFPVPAVPHGTLNGVLWSLRWEVLFSAALPLVLLFARPLRRAAAFTIPASLACVYLAADRPWMAFLPPFAVGLTLALHETCISTWRHRLRDRGVVVFATATTCSLGADLWLPYSVRAQGPGGTLVLIGAAAAVLCPLLYRSAAHCLEAAPLQWLGSRSFSLYLIHQPIVLALANGLGGPPFWLLASIALPLSFLACEIFYRIAERPTHVLAREIIRRLPSPGPVNASPTEAPALL